MKKWLFILSLAFIITWMVGSGCMQSTNKSGKVLFEIVLRDVDNRLIPEDALTSITLVTQPSYFSIDRRPGGVFILELTQFQEYKVWVNENGKNVIGSGSISTDTTGALIRTLNKLAPPKNNPTTNDSIIIGGRDPKF